MTILSNIFIEIGLDFADHDKEYGQQYLVDLVTKQARILYRQEAVTVEVHLENGSLKVYIEVATLLYIAIGQYGSFRSGIDNLKKDAQTIYQIVIGDLKKNGLSYKYIKNYKVNSGVIDKIKRLIIRLEKLERVDEIDDKTKKEIINIRKYTRKIMYEMSNDEDINFIKNELYTLDKKGLVYEREPKNPLPKYNPTNIFIRNEEENDKYLWEIENMERRLSKK